MKRLIHILFLVLVFATKISAQELNCTVSVVSPQIQGTNEKRIFENLEKALYEFMNTTKWTNDVIDVEERISCTCLMNVTEKVGTEKYKATLQVLSNRPIYKSS